MKFFANYNASRLARLAFCASFAAMLLAVLALLDRLYPLHLPSDGELYSQVVVDRAGRPLRAFADASGIWRYQVSLAEVSPYYLEALLTFEDRRFWWHPGVDPLALARAAASNLRHGKTVSGGSTLTMQVARLLHPHPRTLAGKLKQMLRALQLEWHLSKRDILTLYCNIAPFGGVIEGVQAASFTYLNKPARDLTRAEAALLAALPQSPTRLRPDLHPEAARAARDKVVQRLVDFGVWSEAEADFARLEAVIPRVHKLDTHAGLLARRLRGQDPRAVIHTTIDGPLQRAVEAYLRQHISSLASGATAAALIVDNRSGDVVAYAGTGEFGNRERFGHVDMIPAVRSPGSTLKPLLYAMALDDGLIHAQSLLSDAPITWEAYRPRNFSGAFNGPVSATEALQRSLNVPAVDLLARFGPARFVDRLAHAGFDLEIPDARANLAVILGGAGASLEGLVQTYTAFTNGGAVQALRFQPHVPIRQRRYLFSEGAAWVVHDMLRGVERPNGLRRVGGLAHREAIAWKTGTSYGMRDAWAVGFDARYTLGVWVGRPDGSFVPDNLGRSAAGPLFFVLADHLLAQPEALPRPATVSRDVICWPLGKLAALTAPAHCQKQLDVWLVDGAAPPTPVERDAAIAANPLTLWLRDGYQVPAGCRREALTPTEVALWPRALEPWLPPRRRRSRLIPPVAAGCDAVLGGQRPIEIVDIAERSIYRAPGSRARPVTLRLTTTGGIGRRHWYANGRYLFSHAAGHTESLRLDIRGEVQLVVVDDAGSMAKRDIVVE